MIISLFIFIFHVSALHTAVGYATAWHNFISDFGLGLSLYGLPNSSETCNFRIDFFLYPARQFTY
jgi:hypothetical protein